MSLNIMTFIAGNSKWKGRLSTVDLLIIVECFVIKLNYIFNFKMSLSKLVSSRRSTVQKGSLFSMTALSIEFKTQISALITFSILALSITKLWMLNVVAPSSTWSKFMSVQSLYDRLFSLLAHLVYTIGPSLTSGLPKVTAVMATGKVKKKFQYYKNLGKRFNEALSLAWRHYRSLF